MVFGTSLRIPGSSSHDKNRTKRRRQRVRFWLYGRLFQAIRPVPASRHVQPARPSRLQGPGNERLRVSSARHHSQAARAAVYRTHTRVIPPQSTSETLSSNVNGRRQDSLYRSAQASLPGCRRQRSITGNTGAANYHQPSINTRVTFHTPCANCPVH
ncbi:unnamed protein product [Trichogramma brassicae]|uniref:Uncharacterized protein n=1 Tax=Trichogramma brassicae TaxID=86971 RepID=A0A6H5IXN8_9HYME|nr:unnamed protein product [Trichogramma brassicae]